MLPGRCCIAIAALELGNGDSWCHMCAFRFHFWGRKVNWNQASHVRASSVPTCKCIQRDRRYFAKCQGESVSVFRWFSQMPPLSGCPYKANTNGTIGCQNSLAQCSGHLYRGKDSHVGTPVDLNVCLNRIGLGFWENHGNRMQPSSSRVSPVTYHSVVAVRYPDLCRCINSAWELGSFASGGIPSKPPGFQFVLWDTNARINGLVAVDLETLVSQVLSYCLTNAGFANGLFVMTTATDHKNNLNSSALKKNYARKLRVETIANSAGGTAEVAIVAQPSTGFLNTRFYPNGSPTEDTEDCLGRITVGLTRSKSLTLLHQLTHSLMNWNLSRCCFACVGCFLVCLVLCLCVFVFLCFVCFWGFCFVSFVLGWLHCDSTQDYVTVLHQFTFEATQPQTACVCLN